MRLGNFCLLYAVLLLDTNHQHFCCTAVDAKERESPALRILSPFYYEPLEPDEFEVKIDLSSLLAPCSVVLRINGVERAGHVHENATQNSVWTWRPEESLLRELDGFNGLQVMALQAVCKKKPADEQRSCLDDSPVVASTSIDFEIVRFNKLLYSGACPEQGEKDGKVPGKGNITPEELSQVLHGYRPATARILETLSPMVARRLNAHQHRGRHCPIARFVLWNSFGVHGFGSQLQALRIGLSSPTLTLSTSVRAPRSTPTQAPA
jgi:hypothetical protein